MTRRLLQVATWRDTSTRLETTNLSMRRCYHWWRTYGHGHILMCGLVNHMQDESHCWTQQDEEDFRSQELDRKKSCATILLLDRWFISYLSPFFVSGGVLHSYSSSSPLGCLDPLFFKVALRRTGGEFNWGENPHENPHENSHELPVKKLQQKIQ